MKKVCENLALWLGRWKEEAKAILVEVCVASPNQEKLSKEVDDVKEEHHSIFFIYKADR